MPRVLSMLSAMRMLRALFLGALLSAACASHSLPPRTLLKADLEAMREAVATTVSDASRATRLNQAINGVEAQLVSFGKVAGTFYADMSALNSRPDATRAEFDSLVDQFEKQRIATRKRLLELHLEMTAATTAHEWKVLFPYERALLKVPPES